MSKQLVRELTQIKKVLFEEQARLTFAIDDLRDDDYQGAWAGVRSLRDRLPTRRELDEIINELDSLR